MPEEPNNIEDQEEPQAPAPESPDATAPESEPVSESESVSESPTAPDGGESATESIVSETAPSEDGESEGGSSDGDQVPTSDVEAAMEAMLGGADQDASAEEPASQSRGLPTNAQTFEPPDFSETAAPSGASHINLLDDVELDVKIELGRAEMLIEDVLALGAGSVVELNKAAGDPVDIYVNDRLVARGEVLVLNDDFCVRINDILSSVPELEEAR